MNFLKNTFCNLFLVVAVDDLMITILGWMNDDERRADVLLVLTRSNKRKQTKEIRNQKMRKMKFKRQIDFAIFIIWTLTIIKGAIVMTAVRLIG